MKNYVFSALFAFVAVAIIAIVYSFDANSGIAIIAGAAFAMTEESFDEMTLAVKQFVERSDQKLAAFDSTMADFIQKQVRRGGDDFNSRPSESPGAVFVKSEEFKNLVKNERGRASLSMKATLSLGGTSGGALAPAQRIQGATELGRRRISFRDVLAPGSTESSSIEFVKQTTRTNAAATVAELGLKPEATLAYELATAPVRTIAVTLPASRQVLSDAPMLQSMIDGELRYMLEDVEEQQLLNGDGLGSNILGIIPQATAYAPPGGLTAATMIDMLLLAIAQNEAAKFETDFICLNPLDWRRIQLLKDTNGRYLANGPYSQEQIARLWSTPVVTTQAIAVDKFLVGDGKRGAQVFDRWQARVEVSTEHGTFFTQNMVMMLAEERLALAVYRPTAFVYGDFGNVV